DAAWQLAAPAADPAGGRPDPTAVGLAAPDAAWQLPAPAAEPAGGRAAPAATEPAAPDAAWQLPAPAADPAGGRPDPAAPDAARQLSAAAGAGRPELAQPADSARPELAQSADSGCRGSGRVGGGDWASPVQAASAAGGPGGGGGGEGEAAASGGRRSAPAEAARLLAGLVDVGARTVAFVRSRYSAEAVAQAARMLLGGAAGAGRLATYRGGYLPEERRELERHLKDGTLLGLVSTSALEMGIDVAGLDAVLIAGWPGTLVALRQQAGRSGRAGSDGLAVWIAGLDPLDCYLVDHPDAVLAAPLEAAVFDPSNPYVMAPHLAAAAAEWPLDQPELAALDPAAGQVAESLAATGALRRRGQRWFWVLPERATDLTDLRGAGGGLVQLVEAATGQVLGTVEASRAPAAAHPGAVYLHQGLTFLVVELDLAGGLALLERAKPGHRTMPLDRTQVAVVAEHATQADAQATWHFGLVDVTSQVTGYMRLRDPGSERLGTVALEMPESTLRTAAAWVTLPAATLARAGLGPEEVPAALHAAEHAAIGLLPLLATCDRWDLGGLSTPAHPDTGQATIFIHDAVPGGAGFAERAYQARAALLAAVRDRLESCGCEAGCPSCIQSPKCGNANQVLSKPGALSLVKALTP
ncbi:MAG: DUF1998 domain-containing protein, partial [Bifidobacteriaceae bacterium]|nr:DUF1998 domain-containing protein [Bifidobacteriaceae bacterium]